MEIAIGSKIKELRKTYDRTQENMAQALGVTSQAISRWENGTGYPDIEMIPVIANYFGVTIDALFGYDGDRNEKIREILKHADEMAATETEPSECLDYIRLASAEFPASDAITLYLANTLLRCGWAYYGAVSLSGQVKNDDGTLEDFAHPDYEHNQGNKYWQEALVLYENLIDHTDDADIREEAVEHAVMIYWEFGNSKAIERLAAKAPHIRTSRELILSRNETLNNRGAALMEVLSTFRELLQFANIGIFASKEQRIRERELLISLYHFIFDDGRCGKYHSDLYDLYAQLTGYYWKTGEQEEAFEALASAKKHYDTFYSLLNTGEYRYSSSYTKGTVSDTAEWDTKYGMSNNSPKDFSKNYWFGEEWAPGLQADPRYREIVGEK